MAKKTKKKARNRTSRSNLKTASLSELQAEVARRASEVGGLVAERDELAARVAELDEQIQLLNSLGGGAAPARRGPGRPAKKRRGRPVGSKNRTTKKRAATGRKRPKNSMNLSEALAKMLKGKTMGVNEAAANVQKAGYKTNSANFRTIVNQTLIKDDRFKKVARGQYTAA